MALAVVLVALGIGLGAGPLQGDQEQGQRTDARQRAALAERDAQLKELEQSLALANAYTSATAAEVVAGKLAGREVALLSGPGADPQTAGLLVGLVRAAGGTVTAQVGLGGRLLEPGSRGLLDALSSQMVQQTPSAAVPAGADGLARVGGLLARAVGVPPAARRTSAPYDTDAISITSGLKAANLVGSVDVASRAGLAIVLLGPGVDPASTKSFQAVVDAFGSQIPTVVAGPRGTVVDSDLIELLRREGAPRVSTVDSVDASAGRVVTVLALAARTRGVKGDFGALASADGVVPPPP